MRIADRALNHESRELVMPCLPLVPANNHLFELADRKAPVLSMKNALVDGALFQANCTVWHSCPSSPPSLHWSRLPVNSTAVTSMEEKGGLWVSTETIQGRGTCQLHKKEMKCTAQFATVQSESQPVILNISCTFLVFLVCTQLCNYSVHIIYHITEQTTT